MGMFTTSQKEMTGAMMEGMVNRIRENLREEILNGIEPQIQKAIDEAVAQFKVDFQAYMRPDTMKHTWELIITRMDKS